MIKYTSLVCFVTTLSLTLLSFINSVKTEQENHAPVVKIISPQNNSSFAKGAQITYKVSVADKEDGDTKYDEINVKEILLEVRYLKNGKMPKDGVIAQNKLGLDMIMSSNCVNCHNFNSKAMGPSFYDIDKRYSGTKTPADSLIKHIIKGSSGIWGKEKMPGHTELTEQEAKNIVKWIMKSAADPMVNYFVGTNGYFQLQPAQGAGTYQLTASYTDHGIKGSSAQHLKGEDVVYIKSN